ncbi:MAG: adenylate cyclase [Thermoproteus sp. JCHS_4]|jgi:adenylate cyclase|nr:MAG: adenylate cyclase [Thermoproteus sp. JCHS_4]
MLEVEQKFRADLGRVREELLRLGASPVEAKEEVDIYFQHPCRDFAETDEALRVRRSGGSGGDVEVSYKGPRMRSSAKARLELTVSADGDVEAVLEALGFRKVAVIKKRREYYSYGSLTISLDDVEGLGQFVEIEAVASSEASLGEAEAEVSALAERLGLAERVDATYLELYLSIFKGGI